MVRKNGSHSGRLKEDRLSKEDWCDAGLVILGQTGPGGLRIDQVCKAMNVTKGSFYWHFQDRQDFLDNLFAYWRGRETTGLIRHVEERYARPEDRIWHVVEFVTLGDYDIASEVAMRQWSQSEEAVRAGLTEVDAERLNFFARQFAAIGFTPEEARMRAISIYSVTLSCGYMFTGETHEALEQRIRASLGLLLARP
ncbi:TetR family transcriptional regulator [Celeribacter persicus]|jgi:Transcriptional regulator|uniref:TetR family transcriptional regulator n=2 Tax=Celeribacter persicus TaxID=1651082 RepID=A0A2T5HWQ7_9RHOB|nr:TetR family transcriptional regulator [Celeribacter persicus]